MTPDLSNLVGTKIYLIPGLGADKRMYQKQLELGLDMEVLEYEVPKKDEPWNDYIDRFAKKIDTSRPFVLIGTSLGGIVSVELTKRLRPEKVIVISTVKRRRELPFWIRLIRYIPINKLLKGKHYKKMTLSAANWMGAKGHDKIRNTIKAMIDDCDPYFIEWAIDRVINWKNKTYHPEILHIHGDNDKLFPIRNVEYTIGVRKGTHVMIVKQADLINKFILLFLQESQRKFTYAE